MQHLYVRVTKSDYLSMSKLLYVDKMISKKRKASDLQNDYVTDTFKLQVVSKWLSMCPELKEHKDTTIRL